MRTAVPESGIMGEKPEPLPGNAGSMRMSTMADAHLRRLFALVGLFAATWLAPVGCEDTLIEPLVLNGGGGSSCAPPATECDESCFDLSTSNAHCGGCDVECAGGAHCQAGSCVCADGATMCDGVCAALDTDPQNCGACGRKCDSDDACQSGDCNHDCDWPALRCSGSCVDPSSNNEHCGGCGIECVGGACSDGECQCASTLVPCGGICVDLDKDPDHCGQCDQQCDSGQACVGGSCL
jgi:hypothetical protein